MQDTRSRKWQLTINNPIEKGFIHDKIKEILSEFSSLVYWCMSDEVGESGTFHITDYLHPWDGYKGQGVVVFEEFKSSLRIQDMLNYLDGYPLELPSRYANKVACYTKVFIISNVLLEDQYRFVQQEDPGVWEAFLRRVHCVRLYSRSGVDVYTVPEYMHGPVDVSGVIPEPEVFQCKFEEVV